MGKWPVSGRNCAALYGFAILIKYAGPEKHRRYCQGHEHYLSGDACPHGGGELSGRARAAEGSKISGAVSRSSRFAARRKRAGEVRGLFSLRGSLPFELHLYRGGGEHG